MTAQNKEKVLITTAIDYVNDVIHIGHAYQKVLADSVARFERLSRGADKIFFVTGTDEHGQKVARVAEDSGEEVKSLVDRIAALDQQEQDALKVSYDRFIRTTDEDHKKTATEFFKRVYDNGYIYKGTYKGLYCEGCEAFKTPKDLIDGKCELHPNKEIQVIEEENWFFKLSAFRDFLKEHFKAHPDFVLPESRYKEMFALIDNLEDVAISRKKESLKWGIEVPVDTDHVMWVWFDALVNYYTYGKQVNAWDEQTKIVHFLGKDNARMHALLWPAMLKAAGETLPTQIYVNGFLSRDGQKISKSLGNVVRPTELVEKYGADPVRYYFLRYGPIVEDADFTVQRLEEVYNADLANGLGNSVARVAKLAEKSGFDFPLSDFQGIYTQDWAEPFQTYRVDLVLQNIWQILGALDKHINTHEPWSITDKDQLKEVLTFEVEEIRKVAFMLEPFLPATSEKIKNIFNVEKIISGNLLFPRINR